MSYKATRNWENANKMVFEGYGEYEIPGIAPVYEVPDSWISFNYARTAKDHGDQIDLSPDRVIKNAKAAGYDVKIYSASQQRARERRRAADRAATNEFLNTSDAQMGGNRRDQRAATRSRRGSSRGV